MKINISAYCFVFLLLLLSSCDRNDKIYAPEQNKITGTGSYTHTAEMYSGTKAVKVFYHIPESSTVQSPILLVMHGIDRNGSQTLNAFTKLADKLNFIVVAPELDDNNFPGGDSYNLGNIFVDGDNPSPSTLNDPDDWTFSILDKVFEDFKAKTGNLSAQYDLFGHSAGGQFVHRFLLFMEGSKTNRVIASAPGWYTLPDQNIQFPYGLALSPFIPSELNKKFELPLHIIVGDKDTNPNGLRHNDYADAQGDNRLERAHYFYDVSEQVAFNMNSSFNWKFSILQGVGHDLLPLAELSVSLLY